MIRDTFYTVSNSEAILSAGKDIKIVLAGVDITDLVDANLQIA